jgi:putative oxidoreductase
MQVLDKLRPLGLLLLRLGLGIIFVSHGYPKLFGHTQQWIGNFQHMGFPAYFAYISGILEFFGGLLLIAGLFTQVAALLIAAEMAIAIWRVHLPQGSVLAVHNYEFPLALAVGAFALATIGAGILSFDQAIFGSRGKAPRRAKDKG